MIIHTLKLPEMVQLNVIFKVLGTYLTNTM